MTTRGQKRSNETMTANTSDNGTVLEMLTNNNKIHNSGPEQITQTDPASAKDVINGRRECPAIAKDQMPGNVRDKGPTLAKDNSKLIIAIRFKKFQGNNFDVYTSKA